MTVSSVQVCPEFPVVQHSMPVTSDCTADLSRKCHGALSGLVQVKRTPGLVSATIDLCSSFPRNTAMDDVQQLGEMLRHYAESEAHKKQLFETQSAAWATRITALFGDIQQWLEPVQAPNLLEVSREAYVAFGPSTPVETSTFKTEKLSIVIAGKPVEFVPDVMGSGGQISLAVMGLTAARYGSISLVGLANGEWQWRKTNGLKDPDTFAFDANFLAQQLQSLIPRDRS
jgi:hypothetical protein